MGDEIGLEVIHSTQKILGKYVKKPQLTEKLLTKPPFRFLHDVVKALIKETGFLKGLFSEAELNSENVKERNAKIAFLNKLIDATRSITNTDLKVKSSKVIAGLEPTETNLLLQALGKAIEQKLDSSKYVSQLNRSTKVKQTTIKSDGDKAKKSSKSVKEISNSKHKKKDSPKINEKKDSNNTKSKKHGESLKTPDKVIEIKEKKDELETEKNITPKSSNDNVLENTLLNENIVNNTEEMVETSAANESLLTKEKEDNILNSKDDNHIDDDNNNKKNSLVRPKSARPKSAAKDQNLAIQKDVLLEKNVSEKENDSVHNADNFLRPPSVRPSSARPGAPRLRPESALPMKEMVTLGKINVIVESFNNKDDDEEEETVIIQTEDKITEPPEKELNIPNDKGQLVEQILEQISETNTNELAKVVKTDIEYDESEQHKGKDNIIKEIEPLRNLVQMLTKTANPLGKLISYLNEDIESMYTELNMWKMSKQQTMETIAKEKRIKEDLSKPLQTQLEEIQSNIKKQEEEILQLRSKIIRNDMLIKKNFNN